MAFLITFLMLNSRTWAFQKSPETFHIKDPLHFSTQVENTRGLGMSRLELSLKRDLARLRVTNPTKFYQIKNNTLENSPLYQSFINEIDEAFWGKNIPKIKEPNLNYYEKYVRNKAPIDLARKIGKKQMLDMISRNWPRLRETIFNDYTVNSWNTARLITLEKMNDDFIYIPRPGSPSYLFKFGDSFVEIDKKTLKFGKVALDINSRLDGNSPPPEAADIIADDADKKSAPRKSSAPNNNPTQDTVPTPPTPPPNYMDSPSTINLENF